MNLYGQLVTYSFLGASDLLFKVAIFSKAARKTLYNHCQMGIMKDTGNRSIKLVLGYEGDGVFSDFICQLVDMFSLNTKVYYLMAYPSKNVRMIVTRILT
jgi:hypothetical protein